MPTVITAGSYGYEESRGGDGGGGEDGDDKGGSRDGDSDVGGIEVRLLRGPLVSRLRFRRQDTSRKGERDRETVGHIAWGTRFYDGALTCTGWALGHTTLQTSSSSIALGYT